MDNINIPPAEDKTPAGFNFASFPEDTQPPRVFPDIQNTRRRSYPSSRPGGAGTERRKHPRPAAAPAKHIGSRTKAAEPTPEQIEPDRTEAQPAQLDPPRPVCIEGRPAEGHEQHARTGSRSGDRNKRPGAPALHPRRSRSTAGADRNIIACLPVFPPQIPSPSRPRRPALLLYILYICYYTPA